MLIQCFSCSRQFEVPQSGIYHCPFCQSLNHCGSQIQAPVIDAYCWEDHWRKDLIASYVATIKNLFTEPTAFFKNLSKREGVRFGALYLLVLLSQGLGMLVSLITSMGFSFLTPILESYFGQRNALSEIIPGLMGAPFVFLCLGLAFPVMILVGLLVSSAINHLFVFLFIKNHKSFETTLKVVGYSMTANVLLVIPILGSLAATIIQIIWLVIGIREMHKTSTSQAVLTVLFPYILCCGLVAGIVGIAFSFVVSNFMAL